MAVAELQLQLLSLNRRAVAYAADLQILAIPLSHAFDHVGHDGARHAPAGTGKLGFIARLDIDRAVFQLGDHVLGQHGLELALRALYRYVLTRHVHRDAGGYRYWFLTYTRHDVSGLFPIIVV